MYEQWEDQEHPMWNDSGFKHEGPAEPAGSRWALFSTDDPNHNKHTGTTADADDQVRYVQFRRYISSSVRYAPFEQVMSSHARSEVCD